MSLKKRGCKIGKGLFRNICTEISTISPPPSCWRMVTDPATISYIKNFSTKKIKEWKNNMIIWTDEGKNAWKRSFKMVYMWERMRKKRLLRKIEKEYWTNKTKGKYLKPKDLQIEHSRRRLFTKGNWIEFSWLWNSDFEFYFFLCNLLLGRTDFKRTFFFFFFVWPVKKK